jgi:hypothetical protein
MAFDIQKLIEMAPLVIGAMKPGSPEAAAVMRGFMRSQEMRRRQQLEDEDRQSQRAYRDAQISNFQADNSRAAASQSITQQLQQEGLELRRAADARAEDAAKRADANALATRTNEFRRAVDQRIPDVVSMYDTPLEAQNQLAADAFRMSQDFGVPASAAGTVLPDMRLQSPKFIRKARELYDTAKKKYGDEADITLKGTIFGDVKPAYLKSIIDAAEAKPKMQVVDTGGGKTVIDVNDTAPGTTYTKTPPPRAPRAATPPKGASPVMSARSALHGAMLSDGAISQDVVRQLRQAGLDPEAEIAAVRKEFLGIGKATITGIERDRMQDIPADELIERGRQTLRSKSTPPANPPAVRSSRTEPPMSVGGTMTRAELRAVAGKLHITEAEAERQAITRGFVIEQ